MSEKLLRVPAGPSASTADASPLPTQAGSRFNTQYVPVLVAVHLIGMLALFPWFFSWTGVVLCLVGNYVFGTLGIAVGYHRLLTHRSFACPRWLERTLSILGACCMQDSPAYWVAIHRRHHHFADDAGDPHSPLAGFFWAHMGWLLVKRDDMEAVPLIERYARELWRDPFHQWLQKSDNWAKLVLLSCGAFFVLGFSLALLSGGSARDGVQFGLSLVVWAGAVRILFGWHSTWAVNSVTHLWGYRNYDSADDSHNNIIVGWLASGEGWHNNHHADPNSAQCGHKWWEFDLAWLTIRLFEAAGLAWNVKRPSPQLMGRASAQQAAN